MTHNPNSLIELDKLNKSALQAKYKEVVGSDPDETLTKAELAKAIIEGSSEHDPAPPQPNPAGEESNPPQPNKVQVEDVPDGYLKLIKTEGGKIVDRTTMTKQTWNLLPPHKYGWQIEKPKELK